MTHDNIDRVYCFTCAYLAVLAKKNAQRLGSSAIPPYRHIEGWKMPKLLVSAEAFGFGPPSKLHAICAEFARRGFENHFVGHDVALTFAQSNHSEFASITPVTGMSELADVSPDGFDAAVSVMDPFLVVWASLHNVPCVYVDSLFWFWRWLPEEEAELRRMVDQVRDAADITAALRYLNTVPMHATQYIAHSLSTITCAQRSPGTRDRAAPTGRQWRVEVVDAVVDLTQRAETARSTWLATTSGILNPLMPVGPALQWLRVATGLIDEAMQLGGHDEPVLLAGNPEVLDRAAGIMPDRIQPAPLDHGGTLRAMNSAIACLTPPGLTTILECAAYGAPVVLLPEQHYGHLRNYRELSRCNPSDAFPQALLNTRVGRQEEPDFLVETQAILQQLTTHFEDRDQVWSRMVAATADGMTAARNGSVYAGQAAAVGEFVGGYAGVRQIGDVLTKLLERADATRR